MTLFAEVRHASSAKVPLVLLHGFGGIGALWGPVVARLDRELPLVIYDLPGHGRSFDAEGAGHAGTMAKAILADLDRRSISAFHLGGHSMGGAVAALIALKVPDRVRSLTLVAPGGFGFEIHHKALQHYASVVEEEQLCAALAAMSAPGHRPEPEALHALSQARRRPGAADRLTAILQSFLVEHDGRTGQGRLPLSAFNGLGVPTRLLWGRADRVLPVSQAISIWAGAEVTLIDAAGHMLMEEAPEAVAAAIGLSVATA